MTAVLWIYLIAATWAGVVAFVWSSVPKSPAYLRKLIFAGGASTFFLMVLLGSIIDHYLTATQKLQKALSQPGVTAPAPEATSFEDELIISISKDGAVAVNDKPVAMAALEEELRKFAAKKKSLVVTVVSDPHAQYGTTRDILDVCEKLKITNITFTVTEPEE